MPGLIKRMDWQHALLFCFSMATMTTAYAQREAAPILGMISLPVLLAAFAGAGLVLSFLPPQPISNRRLFGTIVFCALLAMLFASMAIRIVAHYIPSVVGPGAEVFAAFLVAAGGQWAMPILVERRADLIGWILPSRKGNS